MADPVPEHAHWTVIGADHETELGKCCYCDEVGCYPSQDRWVVCAQHRGW